MRKLLQQEFNSERLQQPLQPQIKWHLHLQFTTL